MLCEVLQTDLVGMLANIGEGTGGVGVFLNVESEHQRRNISPRKSRDSVFVR